MAKRKITIELSDETIAVIERLKVDELSLEEVIPQFIDAGIVDAITSGESTNPLARLMDRIMSSFTGSNKGMNARPLGGGDGSGGGFNVNFIGSGQRGNNRSLYLFGDQADRSKISG